MLKSMTGYGRAQRLENGREVRVEIRAVNHRYFEFSSRIPRAYAYLEEKLKAMLNGRIARGKVEISVSVQRPEGEQQQVQVNAAAAESYVSALREMNRQLGLPDDIHLSTLLRLPDIFTVTKAEEDEAEVWAQVSAVTAEALDAFIAMRTAEGERLAADLSAKLDGVEQMLCKIEAIEPSVAEAYREKLLNKLRELLADTNIDEQRILTETAIFAEKTAIDEETVRLHSHITEFRGLIASAAEPVGKKLDFIVQEMNRETNTIGSKAQNLEITKLVVGLKGEIEKIREQIQNIE